MGDNLGATTVKPALRLTRREALLALLATAAGACAPSAPAPTTAPSQPTAAIKPTTAPAPQPTAAPAVQATAAPVAKPTAAPATQPTAAAKPAAPAAAQVLKVVLGAEPVLFEPSIDTIKSSLVITNTMLETLAMNTPDQKFKPWLAESWQSIAPTKWQVKLKKGVKFHNGEPFNADAVAFSVDVFLKTKGQAKGWFGFITSTEKVDDYTINLVTKEPTSIVPSTLAFLYAFPPKYYGELGPEGFGKKPVGTGPWRFVEWQKGIQVKVEPNPDYWGKKPAVGEVQFRWAPEASSRVALLETGDVHLAQNIPPAMVERVERSSTARIEVIKSMRVVFLPINVKDGPLADVRVRRALNHAIDIESIVKTLFKGRAYANFKGFNYEGFEGYQGDKLEQRKYDPDLAKKLLAEAGHPNGFETSLWHPIGRYMLDKESSEAIVGQWAKVGIKAKLEGMESGAFFTRMAADPVPGIFMIACAPLFLNPAFCPGQYFEKGQVWAGYGATEQTDKLAKTAIAELDDAKRAKAYQDYESYIYKEHVPWVWLWNQQDIYGASNKINWKPRSDELITLEEVSFK